MLASPVSPSVSLGSQSRSSNISTSTSSSPNGTYASPRHPAYLPPSSSSDNNANNQHQASLSPSSQHSITSSNNTENTTSNYSKYTTTSQIDRVNDVLVDKVLNHHSNTYHHHPAPVDTEHEKGQALKRLIAFLDGEEESQAGAVEQQHGEGNAQRLAGPSHALSNAQVRAPPYELIEAQSTDIPVTGSPQHVQDASESVYTPQEHSRHPSTPPPATQHARSHPAQRVVSGSSRDQTYTPRPSSSSSRTYTRQEAHLHPSHGPTGHQAPLHHQDHHQQHHHQQRDIQQQRPEKHTHDHKSRARPTRNMISSTRAPSQSVLLSTQTQLERLKSEVAQLDELVGRLKISSMDGPTGVSQPQSAPAHELRHEHHHNHHDDEHGQHEGRNDDVAREDEDAARREAENEEAEYHKRMLEYESTPASQSDLLHLIRHLDSLVWMRTSTPKESQSQTEAKEGGKANSGNEGRLGRGPRSDNVVLTKGNLDHLARRITAWENVVRKKEEEMRYNFGT